MRIQEESSRKGRYEDRHGRDILTFSCTGFMKRIRKHMCGK